MSHQLCTCACVHFDLLLPFLCCCRRLQDFKWPSNDHLNIILITNLFCIFPQCISMILWVSISWRCWTGIRVRVFSWFDQNVMPWMHVMLVLYKPRMWINEVLLNLEIIRFSSQWGSRCKIRYLELWHLYCIRSVWISVFRAGWYSAKLSLSRYDHSSRQPTKYRKYPKYPVVINRKYPFFSRNEQVTVHLRVFTQFTQESLCNVAWRLEL